MGIDPRLQLTLRWDAYCINLQVAEEYNRQADKDLAEFGMATFIEIPIYNSPLELPDSPVQQKLIQYFR